MSSMELKDINQEHLDELLTKYLETAFAQTSLQQKPIIDVGCQRQMHLFLWQRMELTLLQF